MTYTSEKFNVTVNFNSGDGIPFVLTPGELNGKKVVYFYCGVKHNLNVGDWVELNIPSNPSGIGNKKVLEVFSLGDGQYRSEEKVFSVFNLKFPTNQTLTGTEGTLKRIGTIVNSAETKSIYYVRLHKVLATNSDFNITQAGFENIPFNTKSKIEYSALTPNNTQRVSVKEGSKTFSFVLNKDIHISGLKDNNGIPINELYITLIQRGYMGWFNPPAVNSNNQPTAIDIGWGFNFLANSTDAWWNHSSTNNKDNIPLSSYEQPIGSGQNFYYNDFLSSGATIKGDFCEYNYIEQKEYVLSKMYHKYSFNSNYFFDNSPLNLPSGYAYEPHYPIQIRVLSDYLEFGSKNNIDNIPFWAWYSDYNQTFMWRDLYSLGFIDSDGIGVDYPFINGAHYPYSQVLLLQKPIQRETEIVTTIINQPTTDDCE
jgi:lipoprotein-anchoring transpeptidase ErfK/SrfK